MSAEGSFLQVVHELVAAPQAPGRLIRIQDHVAFVDAGDGTVALIIWPSLTGDELAGRIKELLAQDTVTHLSIVIIGGGEEMQRILGKVQPLMMARRMVRVFHLPDKGEPWGGRRSRLESPMGRVLQRVAAGDAKAGVTREALEKLSQPPPTEKEHKELVEHRAFIDKFRSQRPRLTIGILVSIAVAFGLEVAFGGSEFIPTLVRMGGNNYETLRGESWRLLSSAWLHAGPIHLLVNGYVLYALGGFLERVIGWRRVALLYVASGLGGGLLSALGSNAAVSVGASGAIWGLLAAAGALAFRPAGILPERLIAPLRRTALINLVINASVSFLPEVDLMAHLGGGLVGAALVGTGLLTRGVSSDSETIDKRPLTAAAIAALGIHGAAFAIAVVVGQPWHIVKEPSWTTHELGATGYSIEQPEYLGEPRTFNDGGVEEFVFGEAGDVLAISVAVFPHSGGAFGEAQLATESESFFSEEIDPIEGSKMIGERELFKDREFAVFEETYEFPSSLQVRVHYELRPEATVVTEAWYWSERPPAKSVTARALGSLDRPEPP